MMFHTLPGQKLDSFDQKVEQLTHEHESRNVRDICDEEINVITILCTPSLAILLLTLFVILLLLLFGIIKGIIGMTCLPAVGMCGLGALIDLPRPLSHYEESELKEFPVKYDTIGWPVHPQTNSRTVRAISKRTEFCFNTIFFLAYPIVMIIAAMSACCFTAYDTDDIQQDYTRTRTIMLTEYPSFMKSNAHVAYTCVSDKKKPMYNDDSAEEVDTQYVIQQMHCSEESIKQSKNFMN